MNDPVEILPEESERTRALELHKLYVLGKVVTKDDKKLLAKHGLIPADENSAGAVFARNQSHMAELLATRFNVSVPKQNLSNWMKGKGLPKGTPAFPPSGPNGGWRNVQAGFDWFKEYLAKTSDDISPDLSARAAQADYQRRIDAAEMVSRELAAAKCDGNRNYVTVAQSLALCRATHVAASKAVTQALEVMLPRAVLKLPQLLGLSEQLRAELITAMTAEAEKINAKLQADVAKGLSHEK